MELNLNNLVTVLNSSFVKKILDSMRHIIVMSTNHNFFFEENTLIRKISLQ